MAIYGGKSKGLFRFLAALRQRSFYIELTLFLPGEGGGEGIVVGMADMPDLGADGAERAGAEGIVDTQTDMVVDIGETEVAPTAAEESIAHSAAYFPIGVRKGYVVEIADDDDGIGRGVYLGADAACLLVACASCGLPLGAETVGGFGEGVGMVFGVGKIAVVEAVGLEVVGDKAEGIGADDDVATAGYIGAGGIADSLFVDKRVLGEDHVAELAAAVIDREIDVGIGVFLAHDAFEFAEGEIAVVLIDLHLLEADDIGVLPEKVLDDTVLRGFLEPAHTVGVVGEDLQTVGIG